jgi:hypothetical protein
MVKVGHSQNQAIKALIQALFNDIQKFDVSSSSFAVSVKDSMMASIRSRVLLAAP